jgi:serine/threonine-protein kinase PRP4
MSSTPPANKRPRRRTIEVVVETVVDNIDKFKNDKGEDGEEEDEKDLLNLLNDNEEDFVSLEQRQEDAAAQRRAARRKRLQQLQQQQEQQRPILNPDNNGNHHKKSVVHAYDEHPALFEKTTKESKESNMQSLVGLDDDAKPGAEESHVTVGAVDFITKAAGPSVSNGSKADNDGQNEKNDDHGNDDTDDDDDDDFDMFSSSVSPPLTGVTAAAAVRTGVFATGGEEVDSSRNKQQRQQPKSQHQQDWDDAEGYYKAVIGETISLQIQSYTSAAAATSAVLSSSDNAAAAATIAFRVLGVVGKGVFSTVLKCTTISNSSSCVLPPTVALKCIRHNDSMTKAAQAEIKCLQQLMNASAAGAGGASSTTGIVPLLLPQSHNNHNSTTAGSSSSSASNSSAIHYLEHCGHLILVFPFMEYNLRDVLQKFGKNVGLSLQAVRSYAGQLLAAATHLKRHSILHLDLKPDNILVSADFSTVQLADFGSVMMMQSTDHQNGNSNSSSTAATTTPYLVSRFYRAPEIILGLAPLTFAVDLWSLAVTVAEVFLGRVLFHGHSNNDMLYVFMQHLGPFSNRVIRQHLVSCQKHGPHVVARHFQQEATNFVFLQQTVDAVTGEAVHKVLSLQQSQNNSGKNKAFPLATPLRQKLLQAKSAKDSRALVLQFADLLQKALALDPTRRISLKEALQHEFFQD